MCVYAATSAGRAAVTHPRFRDCRRGSPHPGISIGRMDTTRMTKVEVVSTVA